jgi:hypothetical protein
MSRDRTARTRIREYLRKHGPVDDPTGYATSALKEAIDYRGTPVAFIQLIAAMDREGEIARDIRGKRTYRIAPGRTAELAPEATLQVPAQGGVPAALPVEIDYDRLARALVREFFVQAAQPQAQPVQPVQPVQPQAVSGAPADRLRAERDEYALLLEMARLRLGVLLGDRTEDDTSLLRRLSALSD